MTGEQSRHCVIRHERASRVRANCDSATERSRAGCQYGASVVASDGSADIRWCQRMWLGLVLWCSAICGRRASAMLRSRTSFPDS